MPGHTDDLDGFCHLCGWWHFGGYAMNGDRHPILKDPLCDECYREPAPIEPNAVRVLDPDEEADALRGFRPFGSASPD